MAGIVISGSGIHSSEEGAEAGSLAAVEVALEQAKREAGEVDALLLACPDPDFPVSAEALHGSLGAAGWSWDLDIASSTATFGIRVASELLARGRAGLVAVVRPEPLLARAACEPDGSSSMATAGAYSAIVLEAGDDAGSEVAYEVLGTRLQRTDPALQPELDASVAQHIRAHLWELDLAPDDLRRLWIRHENPERSLDIARRVLGRDADPSEAPIVVDEADAWRGAGSLESFHLHKRDLWEGEVGLLCSMGPQGSLGSTVLRRWEH